jgi:thiol-disulfide isomerase/thioredoxin
MRRVNNLTVTMGVPNSGAVRKNRSWLWLVGGLALGLALGLVLTMLSGRGLSWLASFKSTSLFPAVQQMNQPAPDFQLTNLAGENIRLSELHGKIVLLNFWATWCIPCRQEMPLLQGAQDKYADRLMVLAVNDDESLSQVSSFVQELALHLAVLLDPGGKTNQLFKVRAYPTTVFIDENGIMRYKHIGVLNQDTLTGYLEKLGVSQ